MSLLSEPQTSHHTRHDAGVLAKPDYYDYALPEDGYLTTAGNHMVDNVLYRSGNVNGLSYSEISSNPDHLLEPQTNHHPRCGTDSAPDNPDDYALPNEGYPTPSSTNGMVDNVLYQSGNVRDVYDPEISTCNKRSADPDELLEPQTKHHPRCGTGSAPYNPGDYALPNEGYPVTTSSSGMVDNVLYQSGNVRDVYDQASTCNKTSPDYRTKGGMSSVPGNTGDYALPDDGYLTTPSDSGMVDNDLYQLYWS